MNLPRSRYIDEPKTTLTACFLTVLRFSAGVDYEKDITDFRSLD